MGFLLLSGGTQTPVTPALVSAPSVQVAAVAASKPVKATASYPVTLTAYNAVPEQTDSDPTVTASGAFSNPEVIAARSRDLAGALPFGTIIEIDGSNASVGTCGYSVVEPIIGYRVIADTMNARFTDRIDVLFSTDSNYTMPSGKVMNAGLVLGICDGVTVRVVGHIDITNPNDVPKTQTELAKIVRGTTSAIALK